MSTVADLLMEMAASGVTLRRLPGNRLEARGKLTPAMKDGLREHRDELLEAVPDDTEEFTRLRADMVMQANRYLSGTWFGSADDWSELDALESTFNAAADAGDLSAARDAAKAYVRHCEQLYSHELLGRWSPRYPQPAQCECEDFGFISLAGNFVCPACHPEAHAKAKPEWLRSGNSKASVTPHREKERVTRGTEVQATLRIYTPSEHELAAAAAGIEGGEL